VIGRLANQLNEALPQGLDGERLANWWRHATTRHGDFVIAVDAVDGLDARDAYDPIADARRRKHTRADDHYRPRSGIRPRASWRPNDPGDPIAAESVPAVVHALMRQMRRTLAAEAIALLGRPRACTAVVGTRGGGAHGTQRRRLRRCGRQR